MGLGNLKRALDSENHKETTMFDENELAFLMKTFAVEREQRRIERFSKLREKFVPDLRKRNVASVVLDYDGSGDSTSDYTLVFLNSGGTQINMGTYSDENELVDLLFCAVPEGYENNEGGYGQVILDVNAGTVRNEHSQRYTESTYSEQEYPL